MDRPTDPLGYDVYAKTLWARIQTGLNKDEGGKPLGDDPLVVGIFGEWGAGKSYLLNLIYKLAQKHSKVLANKRSANNVGARGDSGFEITIPVFFQPWKYEHEEHLHVPLLMHIIDAYAEVAVQAQTSDEAGDQLVKEYWNKAKPWLSLSWRRVLRPATESLAGQFSLKIKLAPEIEDLAHGLNNLVTQLQKEREVEAEKTIKASADGHYFYRWHKVIQQLTRPWQFPELLKNDQGQAVKLDGQPRINFVVFIDDLDRCLPEKAVQTLELIKTVFNVESFAFVLALDDEVIERGIGHRYKEYKLQDKKPEMPITGFEYLEKIVHLPFRLPKLTRKQAMDLIRLKELELQPAPDSSLSPIDQETQDKRLLYFKKTTGILSTIKTNTTAANTEIVVEIQSDHCKLLIESFDHHVPRKLIRSVELLYQISRIAEARGRPLTRSEGSDSYVLFALVILQLFQPEIFRVVRRKETSLRSFLSAFVGNPPHWSGHQEISEVSLWQWAVDYHPKRLSGEQKNIPAPHDFASSISYLSTVPDYDSIATDRYYAQQVRLPLVQRLVEHMQIERHAFNPFKWGKALAMKLGEDRVYKLDIREYIEYLSQERDEVFISTKNDLSPIIKNAYARFSTDHGVKISFNLLDNIYGRLISKDLGLQSELPTLLEPYQGQVFDEVSTDYLLKKFEDTEVDRISVLRGLAELAPHIDIQHYGKDFWGLVSGLDKEWLPNPNLPNKITKNPVKASLYLDVQSMLGQDDRFDRDETKDFNGKTFKPLYLLKNRWNDNNEKQEPIPGFVGIPAGTYPVGQPDKTVTGYKLECDIYIARAPVTVDQYSAFIADGGYGENVSDEKAKPYWDDLGWAWRYNTDSFQNAVFSVDKKFRRFSDYRTGELRALPWDWADQQRIGSRALRGINWFEARAYVRWLNAQLKQRGVFRSTLANYGATLPNESEWEIAARAQMQETYDWNHWPWGNDDGLSGQRANISSSHIDHVSVPGCFAPNDWGLLDMAGNVFEWQDVLFSNNPHVSTLDWGNNVAVPTSSSSFFTDLDSASCSSRAVNPAVHGGNYVGLRVMLSQRGLNN